MRETKSVMLVWLDYRVAQMRVRLSGQHEAVIVIRKDGRIELEDTSDLGFPLGLVPDITEFVSDTSVELEAGDGIVLYSDGITEAVTKAGELYGLERLCQVIGAHWDGTAKAIKNAVVTDVRQFVGKREIDDDLTLLVIKQQ
jgi:sigma-B regulation protein RsbU (phosphoserine phosphatase)